MLPRSGHLGGAETQATQDYVYCVMYFCVFASDTNAVGAWRKKPNSKEVSTHVQLSSQAPTSFITLTIDKTSLTHELIIVNNNGIKILYFHLELSRQIITLMLDI